MRSMGESLSTPTAATSGGLTPFDNVFTAGFEDLYLALLRVPEVLLKNFSADRTAVVSEPENGHISPT